MYKIRAWAHDTAHKNNFNPWSADKDPSAQGTALTEQQSVAQNGGEPDQSTTKKPFGRVVIENLRNIFFRSWLNILLVFVPAGIIVKAAGIDPNVVFALNAVAVVPLAGLLTFATECLAHRFSPTIAALLNVSFGNSVELIIFIIALVQNQIRVVQASLIGSILANLLLILGMSMTLGGLKYQEQIYDSSVTQMSSSLLALSSLSLLIPTAFHASFNDLVLADSNVIKLSRGTSVILLLVYVLYMLFQLKSHAYLYEGTPQHLIDAQTQPGILRRMDSTSSSSTDSTSTRSTSVSTVSTGGGSTSKRRRVKRKIRAKLGRKRQPTTEEEVIEEQSDAGPAPQHSDSIQPAPSKEKENEAAQQSAAMREASATTAANMSHASTSPPTTAAKRPFPARGITIRAPPVFRGDNSNPPQQQMNTRSALATSQLRRLRSAPTLPSAGNQQMFTGPAHTASGLSEKTAAGSLGATKVEEEEPGLAMWPAIVLLLASTALVAICAEFMVSSIEHLVDNSPLSEAFVGLIILPIVGNAAEHVTSVVVAAKNKLDLALAVSLGSSIQIALFITPLIVIIGWILDKGMSLYFTLFETVALFISVFVVCFLCLDGKSNYLEGTLLCAAYIIIAVGAFFFPDSEGQSSLTSGTNDGT